MRTGRLEAFSDGVLAIIITIMVLELHEPEGSRWHDLRSAVPTLLSYLLSFVYIGVYWTNHHHLFAATTKVTGGVLWANLHLLLWLSIVPWTTSWLGSSGFDRVPAIVYGISLLMPALAYLIMQRMLVRGEGAGSVLAETLGRSWKGRVSPVLYSAGIVFAVLDIVPVGVALFGVVALIWIVPDRKVELKLRELG